MAEAPLEPPLQGRAGDAARIFGTYYPHVSIGWDNTQRNPSASRESVVVNTTPDAFEACLWKAKAGVSTGNRTWAMLLDGTVIFQIVLVPSCSQWETISPRDVFSVAFAHGKSFGREGRYVHQITDNTFGSQPKFLPVQTKRDGENDLDAGSIQVHQQRLF